MASLILSTSLVPVRASRQRTAVPWRKGTQIDAFRFQRASKAPRPLRICASQAVQGAAEVTDDTFKSLVLESPLPVLVDFTAPWCGPCKMIGPLVDQIAAEYAGELNVYKLNVDDCPKTAKDFGIRSIPVCMVFKGGQKVEAVVGAVQKFKLTEAVKRHL